MTNVNDSGKGSLRDAIDAANSEPAGSIGRIVFDLPTIGGKFPGAPSTVPVIHPTTDLPTLTKPVIIDGYTQPGSARRTTRSAANIPVVIAAGGLTRGLELGTSDSTISGLVITGADGPGIVVNKGDRNTITGSYIGVTNDGTAAPNSGDGISIEDGNYNTVGGSAVEDRNVVSANKGDGVHVVGDGNTVRNDRLGVAPRSAVALGNSLAGVEIEGDHNTVSDSEIGDNVQGVVDVDDVTGVGPENVSRKDGVVVGKLDESIDDALASARPGRRSSDQHLPRPLPKRHRSRVRPTPRRRSRSSIR